MASNLKAMASNLKKMASNLLAMASNLLAMASNLYSHGPAKLRQVSNRKARQGAQIASAASGRERPEREVRTELDGWGETQALRARRSLFLPIIGADCMVT